MCVSLLQDFVLQGLLNFFRIGKDNTLFYDYAFNLEVIKVDKVCTLESTRFQPFMITVTKSADPENSVDIALKVNNQSENVKSSKDLKERIKMI